MAKANKIVDMEPVYAGFLHLNKDRKKPLSLFIVGKKSAAEIVCTAHVSTGVKLNAQRAIVEIVHPGLGTVGYLIPLDYNVTAFKQWCNKIKPKFEIDARAQALGGYVQKTSLAQFMSVTPWIGEFQKRTVLPAYVEG